MMELEEFSVPLGGADHAPDVVLRTDAEALKSLAFEEGYKSGWDDAINTESEKTDRIGAEFARNLQEISLTFHEARAQLLKSFEPFLEDLIGKLTPNIARESVAAIIFEELLPMIEMAPDAPIEVVVAPECSASIEQFLTNANLNTFQVVEESTLAVGQVFLKVGSVERSIDLQRIIHRVSEAIDGLHHHSEKALNYG